jgi:hypothetical protein
MITNYESVPPKQPLNKHYKLEFYKANDSATKSSAEEVGFALIFVTNIKSSFGKKKKNYQRWKIHHNRLLSPSVQY